MVHSRADCCCLGNFLASPKGDQEKTLGPSHEDLGLTLYALGTSVGKQGRTEEAQAYDRRALAIQERGPNIDPVFLAATLHNLGLHTDEARRKEETSRICFRPRSRCNRSRWAQTTRNWRAPCAASGLRPVRRGG